jgi:hypothetical protein
MNTNRSAAYALIAGSAAGLVTMMFHPTGHDVIANASSGARNTLNISVHLLAIGGQALVLAGALAITARLRKHRDLAIAAYVFFAVSGVAVMIAAIASGLIAPAVLERMAGASDAEREVMLSNLRFTGIINQAFAKVYVVFAGIAVLLWSVAILKGAELNRRIGAYGIVLGAVFIVGIATGLLPLHVHGFLAVVVGLGLWFVTAARDLMRDDSSPGG